MKITFLIIFCEMMTAMFTWIKVFKCFEKANHRLFFLLCGFFRVISCKGMHDGPWKQTEFTSSQGTIIFLGRLSETISELSKRIFFANKLFTVLWHESWLANNSINCNCDYIYFFLLYERFQILIKSYVILNLRLILQATLHRVISIWQSIKIDRNSIINKVEKLLQDTTVKNLLNFYTILNSSHDNELLIGTQLMLPCIVFERTHVKWSRICVDYLLEVNFC